MRLYNPFRWHIVKIADAYYVRKLTLFGWGYACDDMLTWYSARTRQRWARHKSLDIAIPLAQKMNGSAELVWTEDVP